MQLDDETPESSTEQVSITPPTEEPPQVEETPAVELVPARHVVRVWNADTGKAMEVKRSIDTGNTLDLWI